MYSTETQWHIDDTDAFWQPQIEGEPSHQKTTYSHHLGGHSQRGAMDVRLNALGREKPGYSQQQQLSLNREIVALVAEQARLSLN